jgi:N-methylhydantoinase A
LADDMEISRVVIPVFPGLFSALGLLLADYRHDYIRSIVTPLAVMKPEAILAHYEDMRRVAREAMQREGVSGEAVRFEPYVDLKYGYQLQELTIPFPLTSDTGSMLDTLAAQFRAAHEQAFGYNTDDPIELVSLRLRALATVGDMKFADLAAQGARSSNGATRSEPREAYFGPQHGLLRTTVFRRADITGVQNGPLIVEEPDTTVVVPPGWAVSRDSYGSLVLTKV